MTPVAGQFPLEATRLAQLPNVTVSFPGEVWTDGKASETIVPGELVMPVASAGNKLYWQRAGSADGGDPRSAIAMHPIQVPDVNNGPLALGPNELVNAALAAGDWVRAYRSASMILTLITPSNAYAPGDLIRWNPTGARPAGKGGTGSWTRVGATLANAFFEVQEWQPTTDDNTIGLLHVRSLRSQF
jgi:hypothetical protein